MQDLFSVLCKTLQVILPHPQAKQPLSLGWMLGVLEENLAGCLTKALGRSSKFLRQLKIDWHRPFPDVQQVLLNTYLKSIDKKNGRDIYDARY
jgi:hypothetical protein